MNAREFRENGVTPPVRVLLLGPVEIVRPDGVQVVGDQQRAVLSVLAAHPGEEIPTERLIERAWGGKPPKSARPALRVHVSKLRLALSLQHTDKPIEHQGTGYRLDPTLVTTDILELRDLVNRIDLSDPAAAAPLVDRALALFRGDPLLDLDDEASQAEAEALIEMRERLREDQVDVLLALGRDQAAASTAAELVFSDPLNERRTRQLMLVLYRTGRQADALAASGRLRDQLREELGVDPDPETRQLEVRILRQDQSLLRPRAGDGLPDENREPQRPRAGDRISVPVRMLVAERLVGASPRVREVAGLTAVLDDLATPETLAAAAGTTVGEIGRALAELHERTLIAEPAPDTPITLQRPEFGTALLDAFDPAERARLHTAAADGLQLALGPFAYALTAIAWHLLAASDGDHPDPRACERAVGAIAQAATSCLAAAFPESAQDLCCEALALDLPAPSRLDLTRLLIEALIAQGLMDRAEEEWHAALELARDIGDSERFALIALTRTWVARSVMMQTNLPDVLAEADALLRPGENALRVRVQSTLMLENTVPGRVPPTPEQLRALRAAAAEIGDAESLRFVLLAEHAGLRASADAARREQVAHELMRLSEGIPEWECRALSELLLDVFVRGGFAEVPELLDRLAAAADAAQVERPQWLRQLTLTSLHRDLGRFEEADREAESALLRGAAAGLPDAMAAEATHRLVSLMLRSSVAPFVPVLERFWTVAPHNPVIPAALALGLAHAGQPNDAHARLNLVVHHVLDGPPTEFTLYILTFASEALWAGAHGTTRLFEELYAHVLPYSGQFVAIGLVSSSVGPVDRILGQLSALAGETERARTHFKAAQEQAEISGSEVWQTRTAADRVRVETPDVVRDLVEHYLPIARRLGMAPSVAAFEGVRPAQPR